MNKEDKNIFAAIIGAGLIGVGLIALIRSSRNAEKKTLAKSAVLSSYKARQKALETGMPILIEKNGGLYQLNPDGSEIFIKTISRSKKTRKRFDLE